MKKVKFTTTLDKDILSKVKIQAIKEERSVSEIIGDLIKKYLKEVGGA